MMTSCRKRGIFRGGGNLAALALAVFAADAAVSAHAGVMKVSVWRGETAVRIMHDAAKAGVASAGTGIGLKTGVAKEVRYLASPAGTRYESRADRVVWGGSGSGVKVLEVSAAAGAKPGRYMAGDVEVTVIDRVLPPPENWKYFLDIWQHPWAVARHAGVKPFSKEHYAAMRPLWKMLADAGNKTLTVTILDRPWNGQCYDAYGSMVRRVRAADGSWSFDWSLFDEYVEFGRSCGLGPAISCYTMCPWGYVVSWEDETGAIRSAKAVPGTDAFNDYWGAFLVAFAAHLKEKDWFEDVLIGIDERSVEDVRNIAALVAEKAPGLKFSFAGHHPPSCFTGIEMHHCCLALHDIADGYAAEAAGRRRAGKVTTFYVCCHPDRPNTLCFNDLEEAFWLGMYPAMSGLDGFLRWAWNSWPEDPLRDASFNGFVEDGEGGWAAMDTFLVYPDGSPSLRFLELKNGIITAEKVRILREQGLFAKELGALATRFDRSAALSGKADFARLRLDALRLVNRQGE